MSDNEPPVDRLTLALAGAGVFGAWYLTENPEARRYKSILQRARDDLRDEIENQQSHSVQDYEAHAADYKATVRSLAQECDETVNVQEIENNLRGESAEVRAITWKQATVTQASICYGETAGEDRLSKVLDELFPEWLKTLTQFSIAAFVSGVSIAATITVIAKLINFGGGGGGGGLGALNDFTNWVRNGIIGSPDVIDDIEATPRPTEDPYYDPNPNGVGSVSASPRAAAQAAGLATGTLAKILELTGYGADRVIEIGAEGILLLAEHTNRSPDWFATHPSETVLIALALVALAAIAAGGGAAVAAGVSIVAAVAGLIGVTITGDRRTLREHFGNRYGVS